MYVATTFLSLSIAYQVVVADTASPALACVSVASSGSTFDTGALSDVTTKYNLSPG